MKLRKIVLCLFLSLIFMVGVNVSNISAEPNSNSSAEISAKLNEIDASLKKQSSWLSPSNSIPLLVALGGWGIAVFSLLRNQKSLEEQKTKEQLFNALKWFEGGVQKRSIGISVIEAHWQTYKDLKPVWITLLTNQAIYLLTESSERDNDVERDNLDRIMNLILSVKELLENSIPVQQRLNLYEAIRNANTMDDAGKNKEDKRPKGIFVKQTSHKMWMTGLEHLAFIPSGSSEQVTEREGETATP